MLDRRKADTRARMRALRRSLDPARQRAAAHALAVKLERLALFSPGRRVAFYVASDAEIDPGPVMNQVIDRGVRCFLPVVPRRGQRRLGFAPWRRGALMRCNRFGIPEPVVSPREHLAARELDAVLVPLVAFDADGNRLGMGGGFYDCTLARPVTDPALCRPRIIGLAHECQRVDRLETAPWDVALQCVVSDARVYRC